MNNEEIKAWLDEHWKAVLAEDPSPNVLATDPFIDSSVVSIRFAVVTQLLGKVADPTRDLLCLQRGSDEDEAGRWDPRSFCTAIVVPWVRENNAVLGGSGDPYVSKPLRAPRLDSDVSRRNQAEWSALTAFLKELEDSKDAQRVEAAAIACLRSVAKLANKSTIVYPLPMRISLPDLCELTATFLGARSGGVRAQVIATALMQVLGQAFSLFARVESSGVNESDSASGRPGDVVGYDASGNVVLAIEVKDRDLTVVEYDNTINKAQSAMISRVLFIVPRLDTNDEDQITAKVKAEWAKGRDVHNLWIPDLLRSTFALLAEDWRTEFLRSVCKELDERRVELTHRQEWADLLRDI